MTETPQDIAFPTLAREGAKIMHLGSNSEQRTSDTWTPREALIDALRAIDAGEWKPDGLVIVAWENDDGQSCYFRQAGDNVLANIGALERTKHLLSTS